MSTTIGVDEIGWEQEVNTVEGQAESIDFRAYESTAYTRDLIRVVELQSELTQIAKRYRDVLCQDLDKFVEAGISVARVDEELSRMIIGAPDGSSSRIRTEQQPQIGEPGW